MRRTAFILIPAVLLSACGADVGGLLKPGGSDANSQLSEDGKGFLMVMSALGMIVEFQKLHDYRTSPPAEALRLVMLRDHIWTYGLTGGAGCNPAVSNPADANQDGVYDNATLTFTAQNCTLQLSGQSGPVSGTIRVQDLGGVYGARLTYADLKVTYAKGDTAFTISLDGVTELRIQASGATTSNQVTTRLVGTQPSGSITLTFANNFSGQFTPTSGAIAKNQSLPAGTFAFAGTTTFTVQTSGSVPTPAQIGRGSYTIELTTPTPLHYNGTCSSANSFFDGGQVRLQIHGVAGADLTETWPPCNSNTPGKR
jgi:hypothetical protein